MSKAFAIATLTICALLPFRLCGAERPTPKVAYGDTPQFWEEYTLVVAKVLDVKHHDEGENVVVSAVRCSIQECVPDRYQAETEFSLRFEIDLQLRPVRDKPGYAIDLNADDRVMLMMTEEERKLIHATPRLPVIPICWDPAAEIDLKLGSDPIELRLDFRGISSFAMLPSWKLYYPKEDDATVAETVQVCRALSEKDVPRRLELIENIQKERPNDRVQDLLRRRLQTTLESSLRHAQEATRLLKQ